MRRPLRWADRFMRAWWPALVALVTVATLATLLFVVDVVAEDRDALRRQAVVLEEQRDQLASIIEHNTRTDAGRAARLDRAVSAVDANMIDHFALHDRNVAEKLNEVMDRIAALLDRPVPAPIVASPPHQAAPAPSAPRTTTPPRSTPPAAPKAPAAPAQPAPTTPDQKNCAKRPDGPRC